MLQIENTKYNQLNWLSSQLRGTKVIQYGALYIKIEGLEEYLETESGCRFHYSKLVDLETPPRVYCYPSPFVPF